MATGKTISFTRPHLDTLPIPAVGDRLVVRDSKVQGLELRVTATGAKTFSLRRRIKGGKVERLTIGTYPNVSIEVARDKAKVADAMHAVGVSAVAAARRERRDATTFEEALRDYLLRKRKGAQALPLRERTKADYLMMIRPAGRASNGREHGPGELHAIAGKRINSLTGTQLQSLHRRLEAVGPTRAAYALRVVRAVLNFNGVSIADDPFAKTTAERDRIRLPQSKPRHRIVDFERLADWWNATGDARNGDTFRMLILTGMRRGELASLRRCDFDERGARLHLKDTKSGKPHTILLSRQALALVTARAAEKKPDDRKPDDLLFVAAANPRKSAELVIAATGIEFSAHDCRRTFATIAAARLPGYVVKRLLNHSAGNDVTAAHYVHLDETTLRSAWQVVADAIAPDAVLATEKVTPIRAAA